jgi:glycosyltransferase involved in cell wall biosynthesis
MSRSYPTILINAHYLHRRVSGLARYARQLADAIEVSGARLVELEPPSILRPKGGGWRRIVRFLGVTLWECVLPGMKLAFGRCDAHVSPAFSAAIGVGTTRRCVVVLHDLAFMEFPQHYTFREKAYFRFNLFVLRRGRHAIVTPSEFVRGEVQRRCRIDPARMHVIAPYCSFPSAVGHRPAGKYFVLLSNAHPRKNIAATVAGFLQSGAVEAGYGLKIVGTFETQVRFSSEDRVEVLPNLDDGELIAQLSGASALLLFSLSEGFGYPVVEAAALGVDSITSERGSLAELIDPGRETWCATTPTEIAGKISKFLSDPGYRESLGRDRAYVMARFGEEKFRKDWASLIAGMI